MRYFDWLAMILFPDGQKRENYRELLFALYETEFYWVVHRDKNRAEDGLKMREIYAYETGESADIFSGCTLLEMFLALAMRCENEIMYDYDQNCGTDFWAILFISGLNLMEMTNDRFDRDEFDYIVNRFMGRKYGPSGQFCPFFCPIKGIDFKRLELAYQLNYYLKWRFSEEFK